MDKREVRIAIGGKVFTIFTDESEDIVREGEKLANKKWNESMEKFSNVDSLSRLLLMMFDLAVEVIKEKEKNKEITALEKRAEEILRSNGGEWRA